MFSVIFPGQGSQSVGMAGNLYREHSYVKELFDKADEILGNSLSSIILNGPKDELDQTENTQPAIFLASYSIYQVIKKETNIDLSKAKYFAGHSLGEYSALAASGAIDFDSTLKLLKKRGRAMQSAVPKGEGGMVAILGEKIENIYELFNNNVGKFECYIANDNSNGQIVVSGKNKDLELLIKELKKKLIKNIKLPVSAPFHCDLMNNAKEIMKNELMNIVLNKPIIPIIQNTTVNATEDTEEIKSNLVNQVTATVRWRETIEKFKELGVDSIIEVGAGNVLTNLAKRSAPNLQRFTLNSKESLENFMRDYSIV